MVNASKLSQPDPGGTNGSPSHCDKTTAMDTVGKKSLLGYQNLLGTS